MMIKCCNYRIHSTVQYSTMKLTNMANLSAYITHISPNRLISRYFKYRTQCNAVILVLVTNTNQVTEWYFTWYFMLGTILLIVWKTHHIILSLLNIGHCSDLWSRLWEYHNERTVWSGSSDFVTINVVIIMW